MNEDHRLDGQTAIVTGAAQGIGQGIALVLSEAGANIVIGDIQDASDTVRQIEQKGGRAVAMLMDTSRPSDAEALVELALQPVRFPGRTRQQCRYRRSPGHHLGPNRRGVAAYHRRQSQRSLLLHPRRPQAHAGGGQRLHRQHQFPGRPSRRRPQRLPSLQRKQGRPHRTNYRLVGPSRR